VIEGCRAQKIKIRTCLAHRLQHTDPRGGRRLYCIEENRPVHAVQTGPVSVTVQSQPVVDYNQLDTDPDLKNRALE
jgi:hypothetical protein